MRTQQKWRERWRDRFVEKALDALVTVVGLGIVAAVGVVFVHLNDVGGPWRDRLIGAVCAMALAAAIITFSIFWSLFWSARSRILAGLTVLILVGLGLLALDFLTQEGVHGAD
jgi:hypothetical protein